MLKLLDKASKNSKDYNHHHHHRHHHHHHHHEKQLSPVGCGIVFLIVSIILLVVGLSGEVEDANFYVGASAICIVISLVGICCCIAAANQENKNVNDKQALNQQQFYNNSPNMAYHNYQQPQYNQQPQMQYQKQPQTPSYPQQQFPPYPTQQQQQPVYQHQYYDQRQKPDPLVYQQQQPYQQPYQEKKAGKKQRRYSE